ncbi:hypothetical protein [Serratia sp. FGI94]|uniref:hypothetical protein n=1 Tax=Serratia sp. FGI94 TaxID=671990 RepID=UPI000F50CAF9|nr:hypothetical protein [Serratia sp. FGI94]
MEKNVAKNVSIFGLIPLGCGRRVGYWQASQPCAFSGRFANGEAALRRLQGWRGKGASLTMEMLFSAHSVNTREFMLNTASGIQPGGGVWRLIILALSILAPATTTCETIKTSYKSYD